MNGGIWGTLPYGGLKPTTPQNDAGMRIEPPMSEPVARVAMPAARAAAEPPDEPPGLKAGFQGLRVTPQSRDSVIAAQQNSGVAERAWMIAPASMMRCTLAAVTSAIMSLKTSEPAVQGCPATSTSSLTATGRPSSGRGPPCRPA